MVLGSIILSIRVYTNTVIGDWTKLPWEQRIFYGLLGGKDLFESMQKQMDELQRILENKRKRWMALKIRLVNDMPIIAFVLLIIGLFLSLNY
jgi:hypothetical protein